MNFDMGDRLGGQVVGAAQMQGGFDRGLCPAADRVGFVILFEHVPARAEIGPERRCLFHGECGGAGEAGQGEVHRRNAGHGAPAGAVLDHCRGVDTAHHLAAGAVIFGDAERVSGGFGGQVPQACAGGGGGDGAPAARCVIVGHGGVLRHGGARAKFIAQHDGCEEIAPGYALCVAQHQRGGEKRSADMALGRVEAVVTVQRVDCHACRQGRARGRSRTPVKQHGQRAAEFGMGVAADDPGQPCAQPAGGNADQVEQAEFRLCADRGGDVGPGQTVDECKRRGHGKFLVATGPA